MNAPETIIQRLMKIKALAQDNGATEAERDTAWSMLEKLLATHGLSLEDLEQSESVLYSFEFDSEYERKLLLQIVGYIRGFREGKQISWFRDGLKRKSLLLKLTPTEYTDLKTLYPLYRAAWASELDKFFTAFISAQKLGAPANPDAVLTEDDLIRMMSMRQMAKTVKALPAPHLQLGDGAA